ncbi:hydantoinase/oxoprolinase family protein [Gilvimarinus sp. SDUM040013]|uniref:Hydantoinase/oxoprolinase family protein n=1 Tax=Gilvimarinus gilvus TaxID=3058038 RepID=A0ABU4RXC8_9GAMM|nr:hydantoinase/oxoprolinase family protein [Gilvimarinus sp. SDUM040013]MDO3388660.1 hydantoinase/oxoprolinase family protein [Gilvimarinus sp. SDUM040013]MDX6849555.1 hydantoinase/oxoprolinase family protein [Gilvimarinus sp. SDUM040013]
MLLGIDTGGTFTDFVLVRDGQLSVHKVLSSPDSPEQAILQGIDELGLTPHLARGEVSIVHGSTVATNAALERKGVSTLYVTNRGLADVLSIGRQTRKGLYDLTPTPVDAPVAAELCLEVSARLSSNGSRLEALSDDDINHLQAAIAEHRPAAVAINLLYSFLDDNDEKALEKACPDWVFVSRSSFVLPEYGEYERGIATWLNAYLGPLVQGYLQRLALAIAPCPLGIMQSSGGTIDAHQAGNRAVNLLLSGPAGGLAAAQFIAQQRNLGRSPEPMLTFDMGGTSTDVAMIIDRLLLTNQGRLGPYPIAVPMVDMHTIGAGGGSIASVDAGGLMQVGPESAGASPGPACYGKGGTKVTVTDANAYLGRLRPEYFLGGAMTLDHQAAERAIVALAAELKVTPLAAALGVIRLANEHMVAALRVISVQRGHNPANFRLCCFGGAGGLHVCALAQELGMRSAIVPVHGGVLSALGMLVAPRERQLSRSWQKPSSDSKPDELGQAFAQLAQQGRQQLEQEGVNPSAIEQRYSLDLRYLGQSFSINIPYRESSDIDEAFHRAHEQRYGHRLPIAVELVNLRVQVTAQTQPLSLPKLKNTAAIAIQTVSLPELGDTAIYRREQLCAGQTINGPALIVEQVSTTLVAPGWTLTVDDVGNLLLER